MAYTPQQLSTFRQVAIQQGYNPSDVDSFIASQSPTSSATAGPSTSPQGSDSGILGGIGDLAKNLVTTATGVGRDVLDTGAQGLATLGMGAGNALKSSDIFNAANQFSQGANKALLTPEQQQNLTGPNANLGTALTQGAKDTAGTESFLIPGGAAAKGAGLLAKTASLAGTGALGGAAYSAAQPGATAGNVEAGALLGAGGGLVGGPGGALLKTVLGKGGAKAGQVAAEDIPDSAVRQFASNFVVPSKLAARLDPLGTSRSLLADGVQGTLPEMQNLANSVTGQGGIFPKINREALSKVQGTIPTNDALKGADFSSIPGLSGKEVQQHNKVVQDILTPSDNTSAPNQLSAFDSFDKIRDLENEGYSYKNMSTALSPNVQAEKIGNVYLGAADELQNAVKRSVGEQNILDAVKTPENISAISDISPTLAKKFANASNYDDLRSIQAPYVKLSQMIDLTNNAANTPGAAMAGRVANTIPQALATAGGGAFGGPLGAVVGGTAAHLLTPSIETATSGVLPKLSTKMANVMARSGSTAGNAPLSDILGLRAPVEGSGINAAPAAANEIAGNESPKQEPGTVAQTTGQAPPNIDLENSVRQWYQENLPNVMWNPTLKAALDNEYSNALTQAQQTKDAASISNSISDVAKQITSGGVPLTGALNAAPGVAALRGAVDPNFRQLMQNLAMIQKYAQDNGMDFNINDVSSSNDAYKQLYDLQQKINSKNALVPKLVGSNQLQAPGGGQ